MKYNLCILILFLVFSFVLNRTDVLEFKDDKEETIDISDSELYIGLRITKNGHIALSLKNKDDHKLKKEDFEIGLYNSLSKNGPSYSNDIEFSSLIDGYTVLYSFEKGENEFLIVHIKNLTVDKKATIKITYLSKFEAWTIAIIVLASLLCVLIIIICICKKCCRCCAKS